MVSAVRTHFCLNQLAELKKNYKHTSVPKTLMSGKPNHSLTLQAHWRAWGAFHRFYFIFYSQRNKMKLGWNCVSSAHRTLVCFGQLRIRYVSVKKAIPETIEKDVCRTLVFLWVFKKNVASLFQRLLEKRQIKYLINYSISWFAFRSNIFRLLLNTQIKSPTLPFQTLYTIPGSTHEKHKQIRHEFRAPSLWNFVSHSYASLNDGLLLHSCFLLSDLVSLYLLDGINFVVCVRHLIAMSPWKSFFFIVYVQKGAACRCLHACSSHGGDNMCR